MSIFPFGRQQSHHLKPPFWYQWLLTLIVPLYRLRVWQRSRHETDYADEVLQRFEVATHAKNQQVIWIHAVSVGETNAAQPIIEHFLQQDLPVLVTNTTRTGQARARELFAAQYPQHFDSVFLPVDSVALMQRFVALYQPRLLVLMETELWPNALAVCHQYGIASALMNARLSERSARGYEKFSCLTHPMLQQLSLIAAQDDDTAQRFIHLGADEQIVAVTGSVKFDLYPPEPLIEQAKQLQQQWQLNTRTVLVAASTHEPEEKQLLQVLTHLQQKITNIVLIIVPRHPQRFDQVAKDIVEQGFALRRRSLGQTIAPDTRVYLADSMGELWQWYALADIAFVGGSLSEHGGHNPLEPARLGVPVVMGMHTFNFKQIVDILSQAGALQQAGSAELLELMLENTLNNATRMVSMRQAALQVMDANQGALIKQLELLDALIA